ncbi:hypothetical protein [Labrys sp. ZIDIC5]|uniref:hypothetical protein n=1 Tax=Labrys sedimenti TaxID=3106036 RepID=UPI002ACAC428|nr:hypothetical protein [Labrys sp. ZIDIC5]MDZ5449188.1 hypothetical protein [Labrys sp. ZIDIC5]
MMAHNRRMASPAKAFCDLAESPGIAKTHRTKERERMGFPSKRLCSWGAQASAVHDKNPAQRPDRLLVFRQPSVGEEEDGGDIERVHHHDEPEHKGGCLRVNPGDESGFLHTNQWRE